MIPNKSRNLALVVAACSAIIVACSNSGSPTGTASSGEQVGPWTGTWKVAVIGGINVEYSMTSDTFTQMSYSVDGILIKGIRAKLTADAATLQIAETEEFNLDQNTGTGTWKPSTKTWKASWTIKGDTMEFRPEGAPFGLKLQRSK